MKNHLDQILNVIFQVKIWQKFTLKKIASKNMPGIL
jgi:hypothetical protein